MDHFGVEDERIRYLFWGYDPPQLTINHAKRYGLSVNDMVSIDSRNANHVKNRINQSVVVIIYKGKHEET